MVKTENNEKSILEHEAVWSDANKKLLCLNTGSWRTERPVVDSETCNRCGFCYIYCPPQCIEIDEGWENFVPNLKFCKGCGVCAKECPKNSITMIPEGD